MKSPSVDRPMNISKGKWYTLEIPSRTENIVQVEEAIIKALEEGDFSDSDVFAVRMALDEALSNAIKHGNRRDPGKSVSVRFLIEDDTITISVKDEGAGFDYTDMPDPTAPERLELPSGRGLLLMRSYMDSVTFNERGNEVTMVKRGRQLEECAQ